MINAVGIDVSKGKSTVAVLQPAGVVIRKPFDISHTSSQINDLISYVGSLDGETRIVMECTGRYHDVMANALYKAGLFVCTVNPHLISNYGDNTIRHVKTDQADSQKIARYALDNWARLRHYTAMDDLRVQLKSLNTQFDFFTRQKVAAADNLISLLDQTYPGVNRLFDSPARSDGSVKWVDFAASFWHVDCVRKIGLAAFTDRYQKFCSRHGYLFQKGKPQEIFDASKDLVAVFPKEKVYKELVLSAIEQWNASSRHVELIRSEMDRVASQLPEYGTVMSMTGVGHSFGPQLIAEIGDVSRFHSRGAITAYAGVDPGKNDSGTRFAKSVPTSKCGPPRLRKVLFQIMSCLLQLKPQDDPVYQFLDKKRSEGKPYYVYMTAGANKFLRIYYGKVNEALALQNSDSNS